MTLLAVAEHIGRSLADIADKVTSEGDHRVIVHKVAIGKQLFLIRCEEGEPDKIEPPV